jgi:hypothetical protein
MMGNRVTLERTYFRSKESLGEESEGFRIYDDYDQDYNNTVEPVAMLYEPLIFLAYIIKNGHVSDRAGLMLDYAMDNGMYIDDDWFEAEQVSECINKASGE